MGINKFILMWEKPWFKLLPFDIYIYNSYDMHAAQKSYLGLLLKQF